MTLLKQLFYVLTQAAAAKPPRKSSGNHCWPFKPIISRSLRALVVSPHPAATGSARAPIKFLQPIPPLPAPSAFSASFQPLRRRSNVTESLRTAYRQLHSQALPASSAAFHRHSLSSSKPTSKPVIPSSSKWSQRAAGMSVEAVDNIAQGRVWTGQRERDRTGGRDRRTSSCY